MSIPEEDLVALSEYLDGGLSEAEREAFEARLAEEPALKAELDAMRSMLEAMTGLGDDDDVDLRAGVERKPADARAGLLQPALQARAAPGRLFLGVAVVAFAAIVLVSSLVDRSLIRADVPTRKRTATMRPRTSGSVRHRWSAGHDPARARLHDRGRRGRRHRGRRGRARRALRRRYVGEGRHLGDPRPARRARRSRAGPERPRAGHAAPGGARPARRHRRHRDHAGERRPLSDARRRGRLAPMGGPIYTPP